MANTSADSWDIAAPANTDVQSNGATEIRLLREGVEQRVKKEHVQPAGSNAGGEHKPGSAIAYVQASAPTVRPDGSTVFTSIDKGRLWVDTDDKKLYYLDSSQIFQGVTASDIVDGAITAAKIASNAVTTAKIIDGAVTVAKIAQHTFTATGAPSGAWLVAIEAFANFFWQADDIARNKFSPGFLGTSDIGRALMEDGYITAAKMGFTFAKINIQAYASATQPININFGFAADAVLIVPVGSAGGMGFATRTNNDTTVYWADGTTTLLALQWTATGFNVIAARGAGVKVNPAGTATFWVLGLLQG